MYTGRHHFLSILLVKWCIPRETSFLVYITCKVQWTIQSQWYFIKNQIRQLLKWIMDVHLMSIRKPYNSYSINHVLTMKSIMSRINDYSLLLVLATVYSSQPIQNKQGFQYFSIIPVVKPALRGHLWDKEKVAL